MRLLSLASTFFALAFPLVSAHGLVYQVLGSNGKVGTGLGVLGATPGGKSHTEFYYAPRWLTSRPQDKVCGGHRYKGGSTFYTVDWRGEMDKQVAQGLPTTSGDVVTIGYWQTNRDGAGPFRAEVSLDATGDSWQPMQVITQVPGTGGKSELFGRQHKFQAKLPSGTKCSGPGGACLMRMKNANVNPFGGCAVVRRG